MKLKAKTGRPTKYETAFAKIAEDFLSSGKSITQLAKKMNVVREKGGRNDLWLVDSNFGMY
jgi:hypothetical protein